MYNFKSKKSIDREFLYKLIVDSGTLQNPKLPGFLERYRVIKCLEKLEILKPQCALGQRNC